LFNQATPIFFRPSIRPFHKPTQHRSHQTNDKAVSGFIVLQNPNRFLFIQNAVSRVEVLRTELNLFIRIGVDVEQPIRRVTEPTHHSGFGAASVIVNDLKDRLSPLTRAAPGMAEEQESMP
jgi:hypothetical protein